MSCHPGIGPSPADRQCKQGRQLRDEVQSFQRMARIMCKLGLQDPESSQCGVGAFVGDTRKGVSAAATESRIKEAGPREQLIRVL